MSPTALADESVLTERKSAATRTLAGRSSHIWLCALFFLSGFPALLYQIVWQRALFAIYGVNVESVTVVVTAFMLGLGLGSLAGGRLSRSRLPLVAVFAVVELGTAAYGALSLHLFHATARLTAGASTLETGVCAFALVVIPTILMGSTLLILLAYLVRVLPNTGRATGLLYFANTLGSATACFAAGWFTMRLLGMSGTVRLAAAMNALVGTTALAIWFAMRRRESQPLYGEEAAELGGDAGTLWYPLGIVVAALSGFIALGYEIVWYRVFSWASGTNPKTFAFMLGAYLAGLAFGALAVERRCRKSGHGRNHLWFGGVMLFGGNIVAVLLPPLFAGAVLVMPWLYAQSFAMVLLACASAMLGTTFPLVCHLTVPPNRYAGQKLSFLYVANIVGSASGSFVAGFVLTEVLSLRGISTLYSVAGIVMALALMSGAGVGRRRGALVAMLIGAGVVGFVTPMYRQVYERLCYKLDSPPFAQIIENRHGVIAISPDNATIFGGGIYDGQFNVDPTPTHDGNGITRCYTAFAFLSRPPKHVLMIGLSGGSWAQVIANHPDVVDVTVVEINPGYLNVIPLHPQVAALLRNPKVKIVVDDGRRWLWRNPTAKFDLVVMNTSYFWRANETNLLSREFLELIRSHLERGGAHFYNTTMSPDVQYTALSVFPYAVRIGSFILTSDAPLRFSPERWTRLMTGFRIDGRPVLDISRTASQNYIKSVSDSAVSMSANSFFEDESALRTRLAGRTVVTDDNMAVEWRGDTRH